MITSKYPAFPPSALTRNGARSRVDSTPRKHALRSDRPRPAPADFKAECIVQPSGYVHQTSRLTSTISRLCTHIHNASPPSRNSVCPQAVPPIYAEASGNPANPSVVFAHGFALSGIVFDKLFSNPRMLEKLYLLSKIRCMRPRAKREAELRRRSRRDSAYACVCWMQHPVNPESHITLIISNICSHISPVPLVGAIALGGPLCVATAAKTLKPKLLELLRKFVSPDAATALETRVEFIDACFADPENVPFADKAAWIGSTVLQPPAVTAAISVGHKPDQTELVALGAQGFPAMVLYGTEDQIQDGAVAAAEARPYFTDLEVAVIEGGSHSVFYDNLDETVGHILAFFLRINGQKITVPPGIASTASAESSPPTTATHAHFYNAPLDTSAHNLPIACTAHLALISQLWYHSSTGLFAFYFKIEFGQLRLRGNAMALSSLPLSYHSCALFNLEVFQQSCTRLEQVIFNHSTEFASPKICLILVLNICRIPVNKLGGY
ncbi:hypothetical protein B0H14DRAFT_3146683 [Mycena olivaceomarginata]|nr:hypothetical protein B0H14DRAFT_3146683 [Mycena olivaceomarginata]